MQRPLEVIVTSGGTISKIDDVRHIGNASSGTTGARIAEEFLLRGAKVHYVHAKDAKRPFRSGMVIDPDKDLEEQIGKVRTVCEQYQEHKGRLTEYAFETFEEYYSLLHSLVSKQEADVCVLAAAVSDYSAKRHEGKLSSDNDAMTISLSQNPKVISQVKEWNPKVFLVGFKLLSGADPQELIDTAYKHGIRNHSSLTVANSLISGDFGKRINYIITPEKSVTSVGLEDVASTLADTVYARVSDKHYHTEHEMLPACASLLSDDEAHSFRDTVRRLWSLNLFEEYYPGAGMHFGFVAQRLHSGGFIITSRGSDKRDPREQDYAIVKNTDFLRRILYVESSGNKATLNANVAASVFSQRSDVNIILHSHVSLGLPNRTAVDYSPGTQEDMDEVARRLMHDDAVEMVNHGIMIASPALCGIIDTLQASQVYRRAADRYDLIYSRFRASPDFIDLVRKVVPQSNRILDMAAGTGDVACQLLRCGYARLALADPSSAMLDVARKKLFGYGPAIGYHNASFGSIGIKDTFDAIVVRQAINYCMDSKGLVCAAEDMADHLRRGGWLIFNAPNYYESRQMPSEQVISYSQQGYDVRIREMNLVDGRLLTHTQNCMLFPKDGSTPEKVYDLNRFCLFTKDEFEDAVRTAGFRSAHFFGFGLMPWTPDSKSLYCVACR